MSIKNEEKTSVNKNFKCLPLWLLSAYPFGFLLTLMASTFIFPTTVSASSYKEHSPTSHWVGTWATAPHSPAKGLVSTFKNQTLRQIVHISVGGKQIRIRLSNVKGSEPLVIDAASVGIQDQYQLENVLPATLRTLTFSGNSSVTIPVGAKVLSDPVDLRVKDEDNLAISLYIAKATLAKTYHIEARQTSYLATGDVTQDADIDSSCPTSFTSFTSFTSWFFLTGVDVLKNRKTGAVVTLGNSITNGQNSTEDTNNRWPDVLSRRLLNSRSGKRKMGVLNVGIAGNRILYDLKGRGSSVLARLDQDVLTQTGVTHVILFAGINDIGIPDIPPNLNSDFNLGFPPKVFTQQVSAEEIIAGMKQIVDRVHARELKIFGATILPYKGFFYFTKKGERKRQRVNDWIRRGGYFDGIIDFDAVIRDPDNPKIMRSEYTSDFLHPNDAGMNAMANAIDLRLFR